MKKILLFISNGSELLEISPFVDVFGWNSVISKFKNIKLITASYGESVNATWNLKIKSEINLEKHNIDVDEYEGIIIPGGFGFKGFFEDIKKEEFKNLLKIFYKKNKIIIGVCTGAIALLEAGILKNKKATTYLLDNKRYFDQLKNLGAIPIEKNIVIDENIITTSNPNSAMIIALYLLKKLSSKKNMENISYNMGYSYLNSEIEKINNEIY